VDYTPLACAPPQDQLFGEVVSLEDAAQTSSARNWQDHAEPRGASSKGPEPNWLDFTKVSLPPPEPMSLVHGPVRGLQQTEVPNLFDAIDANHDGVISRAEFAEASRRAFDLHAAPGHGAPPKAAPPKAAPLGPMPPLHSWPGHGGGARTGQPTCNGALSAGPTSSSTGQFPTEAMVAPFGRVESGPSAGRSRTPNRGSGSIAGRSCTPNRGSGSITGRSCSPNQGSGSTAGRGPSPGPSRPVSDSRRGFPCFAHGQAPTAQQLSDSTRSFPGFAYVQAPAPQAKSAMVAPPRMPSVRPPAAAAAFSPPVGVASCNAPGSGHSSAMPPCPPPTLAVPSFTPPFAATASGHPLPPCPPPTAAASPATVPSEPVAVSSIGMFG